MTIDGRNVLIYLAIKYKGDWDKIFLSIKDRESIDEEELKKAVSSVKCKTVTILDKDYPAQLKEIYKPPFVLFYYGDLALANTYSRNLAVVGSREPSEYARKALINIVKDLSVDTTIVSGLALGIDGLAHETCINAGGKTIAVLGCGVDVFYPSSNMKLQETIRESHLLLSEYPEGTKSAPENFPVRNRIIVGLCKGVLVFDVRPMSGSLCTSNLACTLNRYLMTIPYPIGTDFKNNELINEGANLVENARDVREVLGGY